MGVSNPTTQVECTVHRLYFIRLFSSQIQYMTDFKTRTTREGGEVERRE